MKIPKEELISVLSQFNPWWRNEKISDLPNWHRSSFNELLSCATNPPAQRAILLSGARQVGKTTLLLQVIQKLIQNGIPPANILYVTFDHPLIKLAGIDTVLEAWREREPKLQGFEYLFLDEAQFIRDWGTWVKHQVDFVKDRRITFTGSAMPLIEAGQESGVGRWYTIRLTTLSFYEYLKLKELISSDNFNKFSPMSEIDISQALSSPTFGEALKKALNELSKPKLLPLPPLSSLEDLFDWSPQEFSRIAELAKPYVGHFHEYLIRGGFPQLAQVEDIHQIQRLLREDILDKVLKRDMTALFGVRSVLELEQTFLYLCMHDGGLLDLPALCSNLEIKRPTAQHFIDLLEATHLIYRLQPFGYGKDILRAKYKIYLADAAIAPAVLLKGKSILDDATALGIATETAVFKHLYVYYAQQGGRLSYWRGSKNHEVDLTVEIENKLIPFEVKYRAQHTHASELKGLLELCNKKTIERGYVVTKSLSDFGPHLHASHPNTQIMHVPASLLCYWLSILNCGNG